MSVLCFCHGGFGSCGEVDGDRVADSGVRMSMVVVGNHAVDVGAVSRGQDFSLAFEGDGLEGPCLGMRLAW